MTDITRIGPADHGIALVVIQIQFNPATGECTFVLPNQANPLMLYGMIEFCKDEVRRQYIAKQMA